MRRLLQPVQSENGDIIKYLICFFLQTLIASLFVEYFLQNVNNYASNLYTHKMCKSLCLFSTPIANKVYIQTKMYTFKDWTFRAVFIDIKCVIERHYIDRCHSLKKEKREYKNTPWFLQVILEWMKSNVNSFNNKGKIVTLKETNEWKKHAFCLFI